MKLPFVGNADGDGLSGGRKGSVVEALAEAQPVSSVVEGDAGDEEDVDGVCGDRVGAGLGNAEGARGQVVEGGQGTEDHLAGARDPGEKDLGALIEELPQAGGEVDLHTQGGVAGEAGRVGDQRGLAEALTHSGRGVVTLGGGEGASSGSEPSPKV